MNKVRRITGIILVVTLLPLLCALPVGAATSQTTMYYGDVDLSGGFESGHFPQVWDLTCDDLIVSFTYDANGLIDDYGWGAHAYPELGVRQVGSGDFNPSPNTGVWLSADYHGGLDTFDGSTDDNLNGNPNETDLDLDDKLILQKQGGQGEGAYDLPGIPPIPGNNHRVWWDRDGVNPWQNDETANTGGIYQVVINLHATSATTGEAHMSIRGLDQGFEVDGDWSTIELTPAGMTFAGDMTQMQVFYGIWGYGSPSSISFNDIIAEGCLVLEEGMATGGGWFIPEPNASHGLALDGSKATFGFVAKQKSGKSKGDGLNLKSTSYDWVNVATTQAMFEGVGTINGEGAYKFRVRAFDGDKAGGQPDRFEIRIWTDSGSFDMPTNRAEGELGGGQIVVHKK